MKKISKEEIFLKRIEMKEIRKMLGNGEVQHPAMRNNPRGWKKERQMRKRKKS